MQQSGGLLLDSGLTESTPLLPSIPGRQPKRVPFGVPKKKREHLLSLLFLLWNKRDSKDQIAICRWHIAATSANTGCYLNFCPQGRNANESLSAYQKIQIPIWVSGFFIYRGTRKAGRGIAEVKTCRWHVFRPWESPSF